MTDDIIQRLGSCFVIYVIAFIFGVVEMVVLKLGDD